MRWALPVLLFGVGVSLTACAAILGSKQKDFDLRSQPQGAEVFLDGNRLGQTPVKVKLSNQKDHTFVFRKQGTVKQRVCSARVRVVAS